MEILRGAPPYTDHAPAPTAVAIGNFDGVHRGHQIVVDAARRAAQRSDALFGVLTFEPHPRQVFQPDLPPFRLTPEPAKLRKLERLGVERAFVLPFDAALSGLSADAFARDVLARGVGARHVAVGGDFRFGARRSGDVAALREFGAQFGFTVEVVAKVGPEAGAPAFSSSAAREALQAGRPEDAARILGEWHRLEGVVEKGDQRGRDLGYPTANLPLDGVLEPAYGVYAVQIDVLDGPHAGRYEGVSSLGVRPTFDKTIANFETFLFDFSGDLYGAAISVSLIAFLRPELRFDGVEPLIRQMDQDCVDARRALAEARPPWTE